MAESKKKGVSPTPKGPSENVSPSLDDLLSREELDRLSALQLVDLIASKLPNRHSTLLDMVYLRERIAGLEEMNFQAQQALEKMDAIIEKLRSPAFRVGTFLMPIEPDKAHVCVGGTDYVCRIDPNIPLAGLQVGQRVLCNEAFAVVHSLGFDRSGPIVRIDELLSDGRLRIGQESGLTPVVVIRSALLAKEKLKTGLEVRLDANQRVALEVLGIGKRIERSLENVTELPWTAIGGQDGAVTAIRETVEHPFLHKDLYKKFQYNVPKGFLLYGPPGCGKTLLGKATAYNLRQQIKTQTGVDHPEFFLHVKGPEILNMWVGESERQVGDLFSQCRERANDGALAFLFIDEAESILGTRRAGRHSSILSTLVPMFCTEMDGLDSLNDVVIILASNRADLIDPAILRPGRIDRKIKVNRPNREGTRDIYRIYLTDELPYDGALAKEAANIGAAIDRLIERVLELQFARREENKFLEITLRSGRKEMLYRSDLMSGAIIASIVERAKGMAIKRSIATKEEHGISENDLHQAFVAEFNENDIFPPTDITEDWFKLVDFDPENVVKISPVRRESSERRAGRGGVI